MIIVHLRHPDGVIARAAAPMDSLAAPNVVWIDLESPTEEEERAVEQALAIDVLTSEERAALEESARFYRDGDAIYATATLLGRREEGHFVSDAVTFILLPTVLVTVRRIKPRAFEVGQGRASVRIGNAERGADVLDALAESVVERVADILQEGAKEAMRISGRIAGVAQGAELRGELRTIGRWGSICAMTFDSLGSLQRAVVFLEAVEGGCGLKAERLRALRRDIEQLERGAESLQQHLSFLQNGALGLIGAEQNNVLKALSVATMAFVPPTLVASVFGMNFEAMTWFKASWGPWVGFALMATAPALLFALAKWRRWF